MTDRSAGQQPPREFEIGARVAGYRLEERIGAGGMAVVFRAYDSRLDRQVALKVLAPGLDLDDAFRQRFIRESRAAAAVDDPHIIPVFEAGEADGVLFIAMRYVRGGDVRSLIDRAGPLPPGRVSDIVSQAAAALDAAHARGLVHRDVKPANMLLESRPAADLADHVYLSDFGLTKTSLGTSLALTATGEFMGTLEYVAPEQIEGRALDGRSDEYGLACAAFEMLCGRPPFRGEQSISVMYAHLHEPPPAISRYRPELPARLDAVLGRALAKAAADRYASCGEFAAALRQALAGPGGGQSRAGAAHPQTQVARQPVDGGLMAGPAGLAGARQRAAASSPAAAGQSWPAGYREPTLPGRADLSAGPRGGSSSAAEAAADEYGWLSRPAGAPPRPPGADPGRPGRPAVPPAAGRPGRPWWRSPAPLAGLCVLALGLAGGGFLLANRGHPAAAGTAAALTPPGCTRAVAPARQLTGVRSSTVGVPGAFGVAVQGSYAFVSGGSAVTVLRDGGPGLAPVVQRTISVPGAGKGDQVTHDGRYVLAAAGSGAVVISVAEAENGTANPIVGTLKSPGGGSGAAEVVLSPDDQYAFVTVQDDAVVAVFKLGAALAGTFGPADFVGHVPVGKSPVGLAAAGGWLYVANEAGKLSVLSMSKAETDPAHAVAHTVAAGCGPARAVVSADGRVLWVTAARSDALLGFSTAKLSTDPAHALIADVRVGEAPLGIALLAGGSRIIVADSDQNHPPGTASSLAVVDTARALLRKKAVLGYLATGELPRELAVEADGTLLVTVTKAHVVQAVEVRGLP